MKTTRFLTLAVIVLSAIIFSCKGKTSEPASSSEKQAEATKETPKGKYAIKSGIVEYNNQMMGMDSKQTLTFDDYGQKEATEVMMEMMGTKIHSITITKDGFVYNIDLVKKTGTKRPVLTGKLPTDIDFENLTKEMIKDMNIKKEGTEKFLGRNCEKVTIDSKKMGLKGTYLTYKGIALSVNTDMGTIKMKLVAEKFEENPKIPAEKFEVPDDVVITEEAEF